MSPLEPNETEQRLNSYLIFIFFTKKIIIVQLRFSFDDLYWLGFSVYFALACVYTRVLIFNG